MSTAVDRTETISKRFCLVPLKGYAYPRRKSSSRVELLAQDVGSSSCQAHLPLYKAI